MRDAFSLCPSCIFMISLCPAPPPLMIAGPCLAQPICSSRSSWHLPRRVQRWHSPPSKAPEPAARLANSPMSQEPTRLQMVAQAQRLSGAQASFNVIQPSVCLFVCLFRQRQDAACSCSHAASVEVSISVGGCNHPLEREKRDRIGQTVGGGGAR